jgi:hypothetical protein
MEEATKPAPTPRKPKSAKAKPVAPKDTKNGDDNLYEKYGPGGLMRGVNMSNLSKLELLRENMGKRQTSRFPAFQKYLKTIKPIKKHSMPFYTHALPPKKRQNYSNFVSLYSVLELEAN